MHVAIEASLKSGFSVAKTVKDSLGIQTDIQDRACCMNLKDHILKSFQPRLELRKTKVVNRDSRELSKACVSLNLATGISNSPF